MTDIQILALIVALCGNPSKSNACVHQTLDCSNKTKHMKNLNRLESIRYCVKYQPINPLKIRKFKWM